VQCLQELQPEEFNYLHGMTSLSALFKLKRQWLFEGACAFSGAEWPDRQPVMPLRLSGINYPQSLWAKDMRLLGQTDPKNGDLHDNCTVIYL
jgi:hypothetical protein